MTVLNHLSLFSGYEGFGLGLKLAGIPIRTVGYVEIDGYCQKLLQARIRDGYLDWAPIIRDIRSADFRPMAGLVDLITAGFPCQPHSFAGKRKGAADERNLWPDTLRVIREVGPGWALLENVSGILANGYAGTVVGELSEIGYDCLWHCVPAAAVGAPHLRWRWWALAYAVNRGLETGGRGRNGAGREVGRRRSNSRDLSAAAHSGSDADVADAEGQPGALWTAPGERPGRPAGGGIDVPNTNRGRAYPEPECQPQCGGAANPGGDGKVWTLADAGHTSPTGRRSWQDKALPRREGRLGHQCSSLLSGDAGERAEQGTGGLWWATEPDVGRVADGVAYRVDRLRACGNGIVPAVEAKFLRGTG